MKKYLFILLLVFSCQIYAQKTEKINVPDRVVYKYCKPKVLEKAKTIVVNELSDKSENTLTEKILFVGPILWTRFSKIESLANIEGGNMTLLVDDKQLTGKMTQDINDSKLIWEQVKKEVSGVDYKLRKATCKELDYYWTVISFDIEEPLIILETSEHKYILDIAPSTLKLLWIDEVPN
jgi:hypothetical protein